jgi:hypothetical protein
MEELADVGNTLKLREAIDPQQRTTKFIRSSLSVIDVLPCSYILTLAGLKKNEWGIKYDLNPAMTAYSAKCSNYGLTSKSGVRLWVTDDTVANDEVGNFYTSNIFEGAINKASGYSKNFNMIKSVLESAAAGSTEDLTKVIINETGLSSVTSNTNLAQTAADIVLLGKKIGLPRIWESSTYNPGLTVTVKLVSPYGDPKAIKKYIIEPIIYTLLLASPESNDGISYGLTKPVRVQAYGMTYMGVASIDSISLRRGGREVAHNIHKQPLAIDMYLSFKPLLEGFGAMVDKPDITTMSDACSPFDTTPTEGAGITTIGNIINSLRPAPSEITKDALESANKNPSPGSGSSSGVSQSGVSSGLSGI